MAVPRGERAQGADDGEGVVLVQEDEELPDDVGWAEGGREGRGEAGCCRARVGCARGWHRAHWGRRREGGGRRPWDSGDVLDCV